MKSKEKTLSCIVLIITLLFSSGGQISGQGKANISAGLGFIDLLNIGFKYQISDQSEAGFNIGYWPPSEPGWFSWNNLVSLSGSFYYHFAGSSEFSEIRPWFGRLGFNVLLDFPTDYTIEIMDPFLRFGRDFYVDKNTAFSIDAGIGLNIYEYTNLFPCFGVCYFHRF